MQRRHWIILAILVLTGAERIEAQNAPMLAGGDSALNACAAAAARKDEGGAKEFAARTSSARWIGSHFTTFSFCSAVSLVLSASGLRPSRLSALLTAFFMGSFSAR